MMESNFEKFNEQKAFEGYDVSTIPTQNGSLELVARETTNTFGPEDDVEMAKEGLIVLPVAFGQNVYRYVENDDKL